MIHNTLEGSCRHLWKETIEFAQVWRASTDPSQAICPRAASKMIDLEQVRWIEGINEIVIRTRSGEDRGQKNDSFKAISEDQIMILS